LERYKEVFPVIEKAVYLILDDNICNTMTVILCNLGKIKETKLYYEKSLKINPILTELLIEKELAVFNKRINSNTKQYTV
jgi:hypothetical protein